MTLDTVRFQNVVEAAKAKAAGNKRWIAAIDKAADAIINNRWIITPLAHCYAITTESGKTYRANGHCQCAAFFRDQPCKHRAAARLLDLYEAATPAASSREDIIADIKARWPHNEINLADELMARFKRNTLEALSIDFLIAIQAAT